MHSLPRSQVRRRSRGARAGCTLPVWGCVWFGWVGGHGRGMFSKGCTERVGVVEGGGTPMPWQCLLKALCTAPNTQLQHVRRPSKAVRGPASIPARSARFCLFPSPSLPAPRPTWPPALSIRLPTTPIPPPHPNRPYTAVCWAYPSGHCYHACSPPPRCSCRPQAFGRIPALTS